MKGPSPKTLIATLSFVAVMSVAVVDFGRTAPGELLAAHARINDLAATESCSQCHGGWTTTMTSSCLECHQTIQAHLDGKIGLHGTLDPGVANNCASCHSDHHGGSFNAVNNLSFARAGVPDRLAFEHTLVGFDMTGRHAEIDCTSCHDHADDTVVPEGAHRYIGLNQSCATCHEDVHEGTFSTTCIVCHDQSSFTDHHFAGHASFLELDGAHGGLSCRECHAEGSEHSLAVLRGPAASRPTGRSCAECHDQPHSASFTVQAAFDRGVPHADTLEGTHKNKLCAGCHEPHHMTFDEDATSLTAAEHAASGFELELPHADVTCAECHEPGAPWATRYPGREADSCAACHADPHAGQFAGAAFAESALEGAAEFLGGAVDEKGCIVCHARTHFAPHTFGTAAHAGTDLPLEGAHLESDCASCHPSVDGVSVFHGVESTCDACHGDAHSGFFSAVLAEAAPAPDHGDCARCHGPVSFSGVPEEAFDHGHWTGYPLEGSHLSAECTSCHEPTAEPDANGRTFGLIETLHGTVTGCATCHTDVHEELFDKEQRLAKVEGREDCARCHSTASFRDLPHGFDHGKWTGWRLTGVHAAADCAHCHEPMRRPDAGGRTWGRAAGTGCASCHASPHGDQFQAPASGESASRGLRAKACTKCHQSAESFKLLSFDHDLESRFPLDDAHKEVSCSSCHTPDEESSAVQYRPLAMDCVDCHGVHEKALRKRHRR